MISHSCVENDDHFAHDGNEGDLSRFAFGLQPLEDGFHVRIETNGWQGCDVESVSDRLSSARYHSLAAHLAEFEKTCE